MEEISNNKYLDFVLNHSITNLVGDNTDLDMTYTIMKGLREIGYEIVYLENGLIDDMAGTIFFREDCTSIFKSISNFGKNVLLVINDNNIKIETLYNYTHIINLRVIKLSDVPVGNKEDVMELDFSKISENELRYESDIKIRRCTDNLKFRLDVCIDLLKGMINDSWSNCKVV